MDKRGFLGANNMSQIELRAEIEARGGCSDRDLSEFDFESLTGFDPFVFVKCTIADSKIRSDALAGSRWEDCKFINCEFIGAQLRDNVYLRCSFFDPSTTVGSSFRFCDLVRARFENCDLSLVTFLRCDGFEIVFSDCQMRGTIFNATTFQKKLGKKILSTATFERCRLVDAVLAQLDLTSCQFRECDLTDANLSDTRFVNAELSRCDLVGTQIENADFSGADLRQSSLTGFSLVNVAGYASMRISVTEQHYLLASLGIEVWPDD